MTRTSRDGALTSGQLALAVGVSPDTIRHYEKLGLLPKAARTAAGYRIYPAAALIRVQTIRSALRAGFGLAELTKIFSERDAGGLPCHRVAEMASAKVADLDRRIGELEQLRDWLSTTVTRWQQTLETTPAGKRARLLESLIANQPPVQKGPSREENASPIAPHPRSGMRSSRRTNSI